MPTTSNTAVRNRQWKTWISKLRRGITAVWKEYQSEILHTFLFFLVYVPLHPFIASHLNKIWVNPVMSLFRPNLTFDCFFLLGIILISYLYREKRLKTFDFIIIALYIYFAYIGTDWTYWKLFKNFSFSSFRYVDAIGLFYSIVITYRVYLNIRNAKINIEIENDYLQIDSPILGSAGDTLGRKRFANEIITILNHVNPTDQSFAIGICGSWGTGKTSLLRMVAEDLQNDKNKHRFSIINFSPWLFNDVEILMNHLFAELEKHFSNSNRALANELKAYSKTLETFEENVFNSKLLQIFNSDKKELSERSSRIREALKSQSKYLVIFIDDLDRLNPDEIIEVLRLIRVVADFPKTFYLVGYDREYLNAAVARELTDANANKFVDKVFNFEFKLPELTPDIISERLKEALVERVSGNKHYTSIGNSQIGLCTNFEDLGRYIRTERDIKRFLNILLIRYLLIKDEVNFYFFFLLEILNYNEPAVYQLLFNNRRTILSPHFKLKFFIDTHDLGRHHLLLQNLFQEKNVDQDFPINNHLYFYTYFQLDIIKGNFSESEFRSLFDQNDLGRKLIEFNAINSNHLRNRLGIYVSDLTELRSEQLTKIQFALIDLFLSITHRKQEVLDSLRPDDVKRWFHKTFSIITSETLTQNDIFSVIANYPDRMNLRILDLFDRKASIELHARYSEFVELQMHLLREYIQVNSNLEDELLQRIRHLHAFVSDTTHLDVHMFSPEWFKENVLKLCKKNFNNLSKAIPVAERISGNFDPGLQWNETRKILKDIFHDFTGLEVATDERGFEFDRIKFMMKGQQMTKAFNYLVRKPQSGTVDGMYDPFIVPFNLELTDDRLVQVDIIPGPENLAWKLGVRLIPTKDLVNGEQGALLPSAQTLVLFHTNMLNHPTNPSTAFQLLYHRGLELKNVIPVPVNNTNQPLSIEIASRTNNRRSPVSIKETDGQVISTTGFVPIEEGIPHTFQFLVWGNEIPIEIEIKITESILFI